MIWAIIAAVVFIIYIFKKSREEDVNHIRNTGGLQASYPNFFSAMEILKDHHSAIEMVRKDAMSVDYRIPLKYADEINVGYFIVTLTHAFKMNLSIYFITNSGKRINGFIKEFKHAEGDVDEDRYITAISDLMRRVQILPEYLTYWESVKASRMY